MMYLKVGRGESSASGWRLRRVKTTSSFSGDRDHLLEVHHIVIKFEVTFSILFKSIVKNRWKTIVEFCMTSDQFITVLPTGRLFGCISQKERNKKWSGQAILQPNFGRFWKKGPKRGWILYKLLPSFNPL